MISIYVVWGFFAPCLVLACGFCFILFYGFHLSLGCVIKKNPVVEEPSALVDMLAYH